MKIIFIRGLPGTGKTTIAEILKCKLPKTKVINVDNFKMEAINRGENFETSRIIAYKKTLKELKKVNPNKLNFFIINELICDQYFFDCLYDFIHQTKTESYWFRLMRKIDDLVAIEEKRNRPIKNSKMDFINLKKDLEAIKIPGEFWIKNDQLSITTKTIMDFLKLN